MCCVHGERATEQAVAASAALFGKGEFNGLDVQTLDGITAELKKASVSVGSSIVDALVEAGLENGKGAARRAIASGGVYVNNEKVVDEDAVFTQEQILADKWVMIRRGKKNWAAGHVAAD